MSVVGAFCTVWRESRYLPLVLEQLEHVPGPVVIIHNELPFFWYGGGEVPKGSESMVPEILADFPQLKVIRPESHLTTETILRNYATTYLKEQGADVALWWDSDFLLDLPEVDRLITTMAASEPRCWTVAARHYWRTFDTTYSIGNFRMGYPTDAVWNDGSFDRRYEETAAHCDVTVHHPSYALNDAEVHQKLSSWFHAPLAHERSWWAKWQDRSWDKEQDLRPADLPIPDGLKERLEQWKCLEGL